MAFENTGISIIGGTGGMGRWFAVFFRNQGFHVLVYGRDAEKTRLAAEELKVDFAEKLDDAVKGADIVLLATPIETVPKLIRSISPYMKAGSVLMDISSVKTNIIEALKEAQIYGVHSLSLHPMFGPGAKTLRGKNILLIPVTKNKEITMRTLGIFEKGGAKVRIINAEQHERMMAYTLALPHFVNLALAKTLASSGLNINELKSFAGTTFTLQLLIAESVVQENLETYASIEIDNPEFSQVASKFLENAELIKKTIDAKSRDNFRVFFTQAKESLASDVSSINAYRKFNSAFEAATEG